MYMINWFYHAEIKGCRHFVSVSTSLASLPFKSFSSPYINDPTALTITFKSIFLLKPS